jgi:hypothetical protein
MPRNSAQEISADGPLDERWVLIKRIADSPQFRASARLREFLFYITDCAMRNAPEETTEQQIGLRVFHRAPGYNSSEDSIVRTHARLLRQKLDAYFANEGRDEPLIVEVPKGHYLPVFLRREEPGPVTHREAPMEVSVVSRAHAADPVEVRVPPPAGRWGWNDGWLATISIVILLTFFVASRWLHRATVPSAVDRFWKPFYADDPPLLVFSNALFIGDSKRGLSYAPQTAQEEKQDNDKLVDTYTGIGELASVYTLTRLFDAHQSHFILKRSRLMTWDEAKLKNLIFIGSTAENPSLKALQSTMDFTIVSTTDTAGIANHHPKLGEPSVYLRPEHPLTRDYAIVALLPGMQPGERILIFSGLTTFGTQSAVEFVCRPETTAELLKQVSGPKGEIRPFEAVLETTITGGVPVQTHLLTVHLH